MPKILILWTLRHSVGLFVHLAHLLQATTPYLDMVSHQSAHLPSLCYCFIIFAGGAGGGHGMNSYQ